MTNEVLTTLITKVALAGFGAVGLLEWIKNFFKFKKTWIWALIMPFVGVGCFAAVNYLPVAVIGGILTVGVVQLNYQVIVQGFKAIIKALLSKTGVNIESTENNNSEPIEEKKDLGEQ